jgi:hypothetical protein
MASWHSEATGLSILNSNWVILKVSFKCH